MFFDQLKGERIFLGKLYKVPEYQRYYEWEVKERTGEVNQFWEDLRGYITSTSQFPLGVFILQENETGYEIVDGQQRLTTLIILLSSLIDLLSQKGKDTSKWKLFLVNPYEGKPILELQSQDNNFFQDCIIKGRDCSNPTTLSQRRIKDAKEFFLKKLENLSDEELEKLQELLKKRIFVFVIKVSDKKEASYMFELHNSRGKPLSNLDKLKSFVLHKLYLENASQQTINYIYNTFGEIYRIEYEISNELERRNIPTNLLSENTIITSFGNLLLSYDYDFEKLRASLKNKKLQDLEKLVSELYRTFKAVENFVKDNSVYANYIKDYLPLKFNFILPFLIKVYLRNLYKRNEILKVLEKILFVHNLAFTNARIEYRIRDFLENVDSIEPQELERKIFEKLHMESYWTKKRLLENLRSHMYNSLARIILKRYEVSLNNYGYSAIPAGEYIHKNSWELEHIAPQSLSNVEIEGYQKCEEFEEKYLHSLGNLLLVSPKHNLYLGNKPFKRKLQSYRKSSLQHHKEIELYAQNNSWNCDSIEQRMQKIAEFVIQEWRL